MQRREIWNLFLPPVSEPAPGEEPDCSLEFVDWDMGTRRHPERTSKISDAVGTKGARAVI